MKTVIRGIFLKQIKVEYSKNLFNVHKDLSFLAERKEIEKFKKLVCNMNNKENYVEHVRALKQPLKHGLILKKYTK